MQNIYQTFEFNKIQDALLEYAKTELAKERISNLTMYESIEDNISSLEDLKEMMSICVRFGYMPIATSANAINLITLAKKTALLTPRDLNLIAEDVLTCKNILSFLKKVDAGYPRIKKMADSFFDLTNLETEIRRVITNCLTIADNATPELKEIRKKIKSAEQQLQQKVMSLSFTYSAYLNDGNATIREGHFVLPVRTADKSKVIGIIYDVSDSGATTFIEPMEIVQLNNTIASLKVEENNECRKILKALTALVLLQEGEIINNNKIIGEFDFMIAKSKYAGEIDADVAKYNEKEQVITLVDARHPLISKDKVVANSFHLDDEKRIVIISGPNAGGKTVSLKTVGLLVLMNQCGLAIPARVAELGFFKNIFVDIGDNQSLSDNLSTFSAHMSHISEIINRVKGKDLVLIDELGTGTDPREGEALAFAVTKYIEGKHALAMISSHFDALKEYAFLSEHLENSSMIFDEEKLLPTYRFRQGAPGKSYALDVATRYGIGEDIVLEARKFLKETQDNDANELLSVLQRKYEETTKLEDNLNRQRKEIERRLKDLENDEKLLKTRKEHLLEDVEDEKSRMLEKARDRIDEVLSSLNKEGTKLHEVIELKKQIDDLEDSPEAITYDEDIDINDYVSVPSLNLNGRVTRINGKKAHILSDVGMAFDIELTKLHKIAQPKREVKVIKTNRYDEAIKTGVGLELNMIGMHIDEAKLALEKYIDSCKLKRYSSVRIIHGFGSGALRNMTHEYLKSQKLKFRTGGMHEGGGGATVVIFNDK